MPKRIVKLLTAEAVANIGAEKKPATKAKKEKKPAKTVKPKADTAIYSRTSKQLNW